jgi:hypothetical protein
MAAQTNAPFVFEGYDGEMTYGVLPDHYFSIQESEYGGSKLPCGGRDSSRCKFFKDPATVHKDNDAWRKPVIKDGVVYPMKVRTENRKRYLCLMRPGGSSGSFGSLSDQIISLGIV